MSPFNLQSTRNFVNMEKDYRKGLERGRKIKCTFRFKVMVIIAGMSLQ